MSMKAIERQAAGTAEFLKVQLAETRKRLDELEARVSEFRRRYLGELPQQMQANMQKVQEELAATEVEGIVREYGAVPATIAVLGGVPRIGLSPDDLELLASDPGVVKVSVRDIAALISRGGSGATTVAATNAVLSARVVLRNKVVST